MLVNVGVCFGNALSSTCYAALCCAMLCVAELCCTLLCHALSCCALSRRAAPFCAALCHPTPLCCAVLYFVVLCHKQDDLFWLAQKRSTFQCHKTSSGQFLKCDTSSSWHRYTQTCSHPKVPNGICVQQTCIRALQPILGADLCPYKHLNRESNSAAVV